MLTFETITDRATWNDRLRHLPHAHILQSWEWGEFKALTTGWQPLRLAFHHDTGLAAMASIGVRSLGPLKVMYAPRGPVFADPGDSPGVGAVLDALAHLARQQHAVWLKIDPGLSAATGIPGADDDQPDATGQALTALLQGRGWRFSADQVQFRNTLTLDLTRSEDDLLMGMSQNTRRKVRTAQKKGVQVRAATPDDLPTLYALYQQTGQRDGFLIRPPAYYARAWQDFMAAGLAHALIAEVNAEAVAHVILFHFGRTCWYFYGASADHHREKMPTYLLQWEAMHWAKAQGYALYDFWGAPDHFDESDRMWGVYGFKRGFRGTVQRGVGAWDYAPFSPAYWGYTRLMPAVIGAMRRLRR